MKNVFLITPGGSGTNMLYSAFGRNELTGNIPAFNPHQRIPAIPIQTENPNILYVMAHPVNILLSFERRFFVSMQTARQAVVNLQGDWNSFLSCAAMGEDCLYSYSRMGINCFRFGDHYAGWKRYADRLGIPFLAVKYKDIESRMEDICAFVGADAEIDFVARQSDYTTDDRAEMIESIQEIHREDINTYERI